MKENYALESSTNFRNITVHVTMDFLFDNLRPVARRSIVRNIIVTAIHAIYETSAVKTCQAIGYHRNSYYGIKTKIEQKLYRTEKEIVDMVIEEYKLKDRMTTPICQADPTTIIAAANEMMNILELDEDLKSQVLSI